MAGQRLTVTKEPVGPVAAFGPWNFPTGNPGRKLGAAIAAGCSVIMKPAEEAPVAALEIARCLLDAGVPKGVCSIVFGVPAEVSAHLLASRLIRKMSFTGSTRVGKQLAKLAAENMIRTTMELGGHAPVLVFDDVDLESVLDLSVAAKFRNAGQVCVSPTRYFVHESIYARFVEGFAARAKAIPVGDGLVETNRMGPLAHAGRVPFLEPLLDDARRCGAKVHAGGSRRAGPGNFFEPTVISDVPNEARIMNEEPFGPIAMVNPFSTVEEAIAQANRLPYGLAAYAFTHSARISHRVASEIESGMVGINSYLVSVPESPFGGVKDSGHGSEEGIEGLEACLVTKFVTEI
jgi:succinate-semialdehyde dehydrogenase/glutarate-semialdehyde dehydrogenase